MEMCLLFLQVLQKYHNDNDYSENKECFSM